MYSPVDGHVTLHYDSDIDHYPLMQVSYSGMLAMKRALSHLQPQHQGHALYNDMPTTTLYIA